MAPNSAHAHKQQTAQYKFLPAQAATQQQQATRATWQAANDRLAIAVDQNAGCTITFAGKPWFSSKGLAVHCDGKWFRSAQDAADTSGLPPAATGSLLKRVGTSGFEGADKLGKFSAYKFDWLAGSAKFQTTFRVYKDTPAIVFSQAFPEGARGTAVKSVKPNDTKNFPAFSPAINDSSVATAFPVFDSTKVPSDSRSMCFYGCWAVPHYSHGLDTYIGGTESGAPLVMFDQSLNTIVLSPLNHFLSAVQIKSPQFNNNALACGVSGRIRELPSNFTQETILYAGQGINQTMYDWGSQLLKVSGKNRAGIDKDEALKYLGYYTDNGAFYMDKNEPGKDFEQTMIDVADYLHKADIPAKYIHLDANWYLFSKKDGGTLDWRPRKDAIPGGLKRLSERTGYPFAVQNSFWSADAVEKKKYGFLQGKTSTLPTSRQFWNDLMSWSRDNKIKLYEQDFLNISFEKSPQVQTSVTVPEQWLSSMDKAATANGVSIAYCMPLVSEYLASTLYPSVTQIRATTDYIANSYQWKIGVNSMLAWSLGMAPFKDTFWSTKFQPGGKYEPKVHESNSELQALVSNLSAGTIGPGDKIGCADRTLLLKTCRPDGLLLKPDRPATPIDRWFLMDQPKGEIYSTQTQVGDQIWHYVLIAAHNQPFALAGTDVNVATNYLVRNPKTGRLVEWNGKNALPIEANETPAGSTPFTYVELAPVSQSGVCFLGEEDKFISVSKQRFASISNDGNSVKLTGVPREMVHLAWHMPGNVIPSEVTVNGSPMKVATSTDKQPDQPSWNAPTQILSVPITVPESGEAAVQLHV